MQLLATLAVVASVLVLAYQARHLAHQSQLANQVAAVQADWNVTQLSIRVNTVFIQYPELRGRFFDHPKSKSSVTDGRLLTIADQYADVLQIALDTATRLGPLGWGTEDVTAWAASTMAASAPLRSIIRDNPGLWPPLDPYVASYDASRQHGADRPAVPPALVADLAPTPDAGQQ